MKKTNNAILDFKNWHANILEACNINIEMAFFYSVRIMCILTRGLNNDQENSADTSIMSNTSVTMKDKHIINIKLTIT